MNESEWNACETEEDAREEEMLVFRSRLEAEYYRWLEAKQQEPT